MEFELINDDYLLRIFGESAAQRQVRVSEVASDMPYSLAYSQVKDDQVLASPFDRLWLFVWARVTGAV
jgi:hypothetical protein